MNNKLETLLVNSFDAFTLFQSVIQSDHAYIHQGIAFTYSAAYSLLGSASKECYFVVPNAAAGGKYIHFRPLTFSSLASPIQITMYENGTYSGGSPLTPFNRNRNSSRTAEMTIYDGTPTITADGTALQTGIIGTGTAPTRINGGSGAGSNEEIILKSNTKYMIRCTNLTSTATTVSMSIFWYEEGSGA